MILLTYCGGGSKVESLKEESISMDFYPWMSDLLLSAEPCGMPWTSQLISISDSICSAWCDIVAPQIGHEIMKLPTRVKICYARVKSSCQEGKLFKT